MATDGVRRRHKLLDQERSNDIAWKRFRYIISASFESTSLIDVIFFQQIYTYYCRSWWCSYYWYNTIQYNTMQCNAMQYNKLYLKSENIKHYNQALTNFYLTLVTKRDPRFQFRQNVDPIPLIDSYQFGQKQK